MPKISNYEEFLENIPDNNHRKIIDDIKNHLLKKFKKEKLEIHIAWNQLMFTVNKTFILAISTSKKHFSIASEKVTHDRFENEYIKNGYKFSKMLFQIQWNQKINYNLLEKIVEIDIDEKRDCNTFWRK